MASPTAAATGPQSTIGGAPLPVAPDINGDIPRAKTAGASASLENGGRRPADAAVTAVADVARSPAGSKTKTTAQQQPARSSASLAFPSFAPAYDVSPTPPGPPSGAGAAPLARTPNTSTSTTTAITAAASSPSAVPTLRPALRSSAATTAPPSSPNTTTPYRRGSSRASSLFGERASVLERRNAEAQAALEATNQLKADITAVEEQVARVERELEDAQRAVAGGGSYRGKAGVALAAEEDRLARKESALREEKRQLREERLVLLRSRSDQQRRGSEVAAKPRRVSFIMSQAHFDDPAEEQAEQQRVAQIEGMITRRQSMSSSSIAGSDRGLGPAEETEDFNDTSSVKTIYPREEDCRLLVRLQAFGLPVLVGTLLSGFTLVLFDVATTNLARRLAVLAFALEISSSTVLCLIMFRGQQLYSHATDVKPRARKFLHSMCNATILSLIMFSLGVVSFVVSFVVEASSEMGDSWLAVLAVVLFPTALAAILFAASTEQVRRFSLPPACVDATE